MQLVPEKGEAAVEYGLRAAVLVPIAGVEEMKEVQLRDEGRWRVVGLQKRIRRFVEGRQGR